MTKTIAGIDVAQAHVDVALDNGAVRRFTMRAQGLAELSVFFKKHYRGLQMSIFSAPLLKYARYSAMRCSKTNIFDGR